MLLLNRYQANEMNLWHTSSALPTLTWRCISLCHQQRLLLLLFAASSQALHSFDLWFLNFLDRWFLFVLLLCCCGKLLSLKHFDGINKTNIELLKKCGDMVPKNRTNKWKTTSYSYSSSSSDWDKFRCATIETIHVAVAATVIAIAFHLCRIFSSRIFPAN